MRGGLPVSPGRAREQYSELLRVLFTADWYIFSTLLGHYYYPIHNDHVFDNPVKRVSTPGFDKVSEGVCIID